MNGTTKTKTKITMEQFLPYSTMEPFLPFYERMKAVEKGESNGDENHHMRNPSTAEVFKNEQERSEGNVVLL